MLKPVRLLRKTLYSAITVVIGTYAYITRRTMRHPLAVKGFIALLAGFPMGGMWYIRNVLYGHPPLVFPAGYWQSAAQRSGQELGWLLLIAAVLVALLVLRRVNSRLAIAGLLVLLVGALPSAFGYRFPTFDEAGQLLMGGIPATVIPAKLGVLEYVILAVGAGMLIWAARPLWQQIDSGRKALLLIIGAFILPYFVTWFWSYSYHPRLSFAMVPALIVLLALLLDRFSAALPKPAPVALRWGYVILIVALALPGYAAGLTALEPAITGAYPIDDMKYTAGNPALMGMVYYLRERRAPGRYPAQLPRPMRVEVPGELRLPFFFPNDDIRTERYPTRLDNLRDIDFFIDSSVGQRLYNERYQPIRANQILSSMTRDNIMRRVYTIDDGNFRFSIYDLDLTARFAPAKPNGPIGVQVGSFAYLIGYDIVTLTSTSGAPIPLTLYWQALGTPDRDYSVFVEIVDPNSGKVVHQFGGEPGAGMWSQWYLKAGAVLTIPYPTHLWQVGEWVRDEWRTVLPEGIPPGIYEWRVGLIDPQTGQKLPVTQNGSVIGESVKVVDMRINMPD